MRGAEIVYSPGYQIPLWLGPAQVRLWRHLDRMLGGQIHATTTVRTIARELGDNPGIVSRNLNALARLGLAVHEASWGKAGVRLWRVTARGGRRGLDAVRQRRALARMGLRAPGQLTLATTEGGPTVGGPPPESSGGSSADPPELYRFAKCPCGRGRVVKTGEPMPECTHPPERSTVFDTRDFDDEGTI